MRNELETLQQIENYLMDKMNPSERAAFENEMQSNPDLAQAVQEQQTLVSGLGRFALRANLQTAAKKVFFKKALFKWGLSLSAGITAVALAIFVGRPGQEVNADRPFVAPPLASVRIPFTEFIVDPETGLDTIISSGSVISVPQHAFLDGNGKQVDKPVTLAYREYLDPIDFFLSGIPMKYDSAGKRYEFESGGMFEINAFLDGEPLKVNPASQIKIQLPLDSARHSFNKYYLDTVARNWVYKGKADIHDAGPSSMAADAASPEKVWKDAQKQVQALEKRKPCEPKKLNENKYNFNIAANPDDFPELAQYKGMRFEVSDETRNFNSSMYKTVWEDVSIMENVPGLNYKLLLKKGETEHSVIVTPVFHGADYKQAVKIFEKKFSKYGKLLKERKEEEERAYQRYLVEQENADMMATKNSVNLSSNRMMQTLAIDGFGFWNSDWPFILPKGALLKLLLADENGEELPNPTGYLVDKSLNALFYYYPKTLNRFEFNPTSENVMWATSGKGLYLFTREDFDKVDTSIGEYTFRMKAVKVELKTKEQLKAVLGL
jgi:hypothetical protein